MRFQIIGIDAATKPANTGLARAAVDEDGLRVTAVVAPKSQGQMLSTLSGWLTDRTLVAIDAPLGWPRALGRVLAGHAAGSPLGAGADQLFSRETDRVVRRVFRKRPMEVGADLIARTAHAALALLGELRERTGRALPLPVAPGPPAEASAIEVYPAVTLLAHGLRYARPRGPTPGAARKHVRADRRRWIAAGLAEVMEIAGPDRAKIEANDHLLDAAVCALAGADFVRGDVMPPPDPDLAAGEGWIWVKGLGPPPG